MTTSEADARPDTSDMLVVHDAFRREFGMLPRLVRGVAPGDAERASVLAEHYTLLVLFLHIHHDGEDVVLWPVLEEKAADRAAVIAEMQSDHGRLSELIAATDARVPAWASTPDAVAGESLAVLLDELDAHLEKHLAHEEREILPLCRERLRRAEWDAVGEHSRSELPQEHAFTILGMLLEDAPPRAGRHMLDVMAPPVVDQWSQVGSSAYGAYTARVRATG